MIARTLATLLMALSFAAISQNQNSVEFKGKVYKVYPYATSKYGVFPIIDSIPDGEYASYSLDNKKKVNGEWQVVKPFLDSTHVASVFTVKNGKKNGPIQVFNRDEQILAEGFYKNDLQDSLWIQYGENDYKRFYHLKDGYVHGDFHTINGKGDTMTIGQFYKGTTNGKWIEKRTKGENNKIQFEYFLNDSAHRLNDSVLFSFGEQYIENVYAWRNSNGSCFSKAYAYDEDGLFSFIHGDYLIYKKDGKIDTMQYAYGSKVYENVVQEEEESFLDTVYYSSDSLKVYKTTSVLIKDSLYKDQFFYEDGSLKGEVKYARYLSRESEEKGLIIYNNRGEYEEKVIRRFYYAKRYMKNGFLKDSIQFDSESDWRRELYNVTYDEKTKNATKVYVKDTLSKTKSFLYASANGDTLAYVESDYPEDSGYARIFHKKELFADMRFDESKEYVDFTFYHKGKLKNGPFKIDIYKHLYTSLGEISIPFKDILGQNEVRSRGMIIQGELLNGKFNGELSVKDYDGHLVATLSFLNGDYEGEQLFYARPPYNRKSKEWFLALSKNYTNGKLDGYKNYYYPNGQLKYKSLYDNGVATSDINGYFDDGVQKIEVRPVDIGFEYRVLAYGYPSKIYHFKDSAALEYIGEKYRYSLRDIYKNGPFFIYDQGGNISSDGFYKEGVKDSVWTHWYDTGLKKHQIEINPDTLSISGKDLEVTYKRGGNGSEKQGYHKYFYQNGTRSHEGEVFKGNRVGEWQFFNETGGLIKRIQYAMDTLQYISENDTTDIPHYGFYESWYDNGVKQTEGYILDEKAEFDCAQESYLKMQEMFYLNHWEKDSTQTLVNGSGLFTSYHNTAKWASHGQLKNGQEDGEWYYWSPDGTLKKKGAYLNGEKHGRWLEGDVDGSAYVDKACYRPEGFASDQDYEDYLAEMSKNVEIKEEFYFKGILVTSVTHLAFLK